MSQTVLFDGTDIRAAGVRYLEFWDGLYAVGDPRGDDVTVPGVDGDDFVEKSIQAYSLPLDLVLATTGQTEFNDARRALIRLAKPDSTVVLTRQIPYTSGTETHSALARYESGLAPKMVGAGAGRLLLTMKILDGVWHGSPVTIGTGASTIAGDVRTRRVTVTFTGGTNPVLTNSSTGETLSWTGAVGGTPVVVDVEAQTATRGGVDVSGALSWSGEYPMTLRAGAQTLALAGGGSVAVAYQPAYQ